MALSATGTWAKASDTQTATVELSSIDYKPLIDKDRAFYDLNYEAIASHVQKIGKMVVEGPKTNRVCRFCGKSEADGLATFKQKAHGFPESIGNKTFITNLECDACNSNFGTDIEDHLGRYLKPYRLLAAIRGKNGFPIIKDDQNGWRVYRNSSGLHVEHDSEHPIVKVDIQNKTMVFSVPCDVFSPLKVYKAFVKMGLCLLPASEVTNFSDAIGWIRGEGGFQFVPPPLSSTFVPGQPIMALSAILFRRTGENRPLPYMTMCMIIANTQFQFMLPCPHRDAHINNQKFTFPQYPFPSGLRIETEALQFEYIDLSNASLVRDFRIQYEFKFDERLEVR